MTPNDSAVPLSPAGAEKIRKARLAKGLTQADLASRVEYFQQAIRQIESGELKLVDMIVLDKLLAVLDLSADELDAD